MIFFCNIIFYGRIFDFSRLLYLIIIYFGRMRKLISANKAAACLFFFAFYRKNSAFSLFATALCRIILKKTVFLHQKNSFFGSKKIVFFRLIRHGAAVKRSKAAESHLKAEDLNRFEKFIHIIIYVLRMSENLFYCNEKIICGLCAVLYCPLRRKRKNENIL